MKAINKSAAKTMRKMMNMMENGYAKIQKSSSFMPVTIEHIGQNDFGKLFSVAHYSEQNGDLMRDPEMVFILCADEEFYPISIQQDYVGKHQDVLEYDDNGKIKGWHPRLQSDIAGFANFWLRNIKEQQSL
ncbi:hypothetical protein EOM81_10385 [bacterium]|nr:hypothetical protein [bacterium]